MDTLRPAQVLDLQAALIDRLQDREFAETCNVRHATWGTLTKITHPNWAKATVNNLRASACFHVSADMTVMVEHASRQLADDDRFTPELLPTERGFAYFMEPLPTADSEGHPVRVRGLQWELTDLGFENGERRVGVQISYWIDYDEHPRMLEELGVDSAPSARRPMFPFHFVFLVDGAHVGPADLSASATGGPDWRPEGVIGTSTNMVRLAVAFFMLLDQTVTESTPADIPRPTAKRSVRAGVQPKVTIIDLRRHAGSRRTGESLVEWTRRWPVRGHWRRQPYKAEDGSTIIRKIWIAPYVKGPADKPIVVSQKVYRVVPE